MIALAKPFQQSDRMHDKASFKKASFDQRFVFAMVRLGKLIGNPNNWPSDAAFYNGLALIAKVIHMKNGLWGKKEEKQSDKWGEWAKTGNNKAAFARAKEVYEELKNLGMV